MRRASRIALILTMMLPLAEPSPAAAADPAFQVIVHPDVSGEQISRAILSAIFLKDAPRWEDGAAVRPVDQSMSSPVRAAFSEAVLAVPVSGLQRLWNSKIQKGVAPPPVKPSDADVVQFVASTKGAIGYVSAGAAAPDGVKAMSIVD